MRSANTSYIGGQEALLEDAGKETVIDVDHVSMSFNMASETLNNLKEYAIAVARRELRFKEFKALDNVSFQVKKGDVYGILGTNGSGKSTLLKIIAGVLDPSKGACTVKGKIAPLIELGAGFDMELTARENIYLNGALLGYSRAFINEHFDEIIEFAEIEQFLDMPLKNYSSGMVARIAFAIATVIVPDILIVDVVLSVGDFMFQQKCERRIASLINDHQVTVLIVSHDNQLIRRLCNKAIWIEKGHVRIVGSANTVCNVYRLLGGHKGSPQAEKAILQRLGPGILDAKSRSITIAGEGCHGTLAKMTEAAKFQNTDLIVLHAGDPNMHAIIASGLAGLFDAPILLARTDRLFDVTSQILKSAAPSKLVLCVEKGDSEATSSLTNEIKELLGDGVDCRVLEFSSSLSSYSCLVYDLGIELGGVWSKTAAVVGADESVAAISLSPYLYSEKIPLFAVDDGSAFNAVSWNTLFSEIIFSTDAVADRCCFDTHGNSSHLRSLNLDAFPKELINGKVNDWILSKRANQRSASFEFVVCRGSGSLDSYVAGPFAGNRDALILVDDPSDLDSVASALNYLEKMASRTEQLVFLGSELCYCALDKALLEESIEN